MHAYLVTGTSQDKRNQHIQHLLRQWRVAPYDTISVMTEGEERIGIDHIRQARTRLALRPFGTICALVIAQAQKLTTEAQAALLKTIEEPPAQVRIILASTTDAAILPTILSRCQLIHLAGTTELLDSAPYKRAAMLVDLTLDTPGPLLSHIDNLAPTRQSASEVINDFLHIIERALRARYRLDNIATSVPKELMDHAPRIARRLLDSLENLSANVTPKLVVDSVFMQNP